VTCAEPRLEAYFDGELDAPAAAEFERHLETCASCRAALEELAELRAALRRELPYEHAPRALSARIAMALDAEAALSAPPAATQSVGPSRRPPRRGSFFMGALAGAGGAAFAALVGFVLVVAPLRDPLLDVLADAHARSLMPAHLIDVESSDRHTVKPWFAGHADVSPVVVDFGAEGYRLVGGRADYFNGQRAAVVVYQHGPHIINVFSWSGGALPRDATRNGYRLAFFKSADLNYCAVSDTGWDELAKLESLIEQADAAPPRPRTP
jgi:anti-sigma factor RsiW